MNLRVAVAGPFLTELLDFPSDWRVVGLRYDSPRDEYMLQIIGPGDAEGQRDIMIRREAGAIVYTDAHGAFLGARELSFFALGAR